MDKIIQFMSPLKIPADVIMGMTFFITVFLIFAPVSIINKMGLPIFVSENIANISLACLISIAYFLISIIKTFCAIISIFIKTNSMRKNLSKLTSAEKRLLLKMYDNDHSATLDMLNPTVGMLNTKRLIYRCSNVGLGTEFPYALQPFVADYINKHPELN